MIVSDHYVSITPNPAVIGQEVEFRCGFGYFTSYVTAIYWTKNNVEVITINGWGISSNLSIDNVITSTEGKLIRKEENIDTYAPVVYMVVAS